MSVRVNGETYRSSSELEEEIRQLQATVANAPEYGPRRRQLQAHIDELQRALRTLKRQDADHATKAAETTTRRLKRDGARRQKEEQRRTNERRRQRQAANARAASGARSFVRASRRDTRRAAGALGVAGPASTAFDLTTTIIGVGLLLILLYLLTNERGRGPAAVAGITGAGTRLFGRILDPTDPLVFGSAPPATPAGRYPSAPAGARTVVLARQPANVRQVQRQTTAAG